MVKVLYHGQRESSILVNFMRTEDTVRESSDGVTAENMMVTGLMGNNMEKEYIGMHKEKSKEENGLMEKESDGLIDE